MMKYVICLIGCLLLTGPIACSSPQHSLSSEERKAAQASQRMIDVSQGRLAPVYAPLANHIVKTFGLRAKAGVGIDIGSGPGDLIVELCKRTHLHWINVDINPHFFPYFFQLADSHGVGHRVSAIQADAQQLPFRDDYADVIVSRGSFQFWEDKSQAFGELFRVLKPGGVAYIGRGFSPDLPVEIARRVRSKQKPGHFPEYDIEDTEAELQQALDAAGIADYVIHIPRSDQDATLSYGVWVEIHKS
jgi:SAM-dependent methyltransferase